MLPKKHGTHSTNSAGTTYIIMHHHSCQVIFDPIPKCLPATKNDVAFANTAQPLRATASGPVELRSARQLHPVRRHRQQSFSSHDSVSSPTNLLHWFNLRPRHCLFYFRILLFPSLDLQLFRPHPKSTQTINQQGVTRWIQIAHKGLIRDCCQSQQSFSIPTLILNAITPSISHILQSQPSGCLHISTACRWPAKPRHTAHRRTTIAAQICPQHTHTNKYAKYKYIFEGFVYC